MIKICREMKKLQYHFSLIHVKFDYYDYSTAIKFYLILRTSMNCRRVIVVDESSETNSERQIEGDELRGTNWGREVL